MKDTISYKLKIPIYNCELVYMVTNDFIESARQLKEELTLDSNENIGLTFKLNNDCLKYVIMVKPRYADDWSIIAHEALHAVNYILSDRGIEATMANDEAQAYLLAYIINQIQKIKNKQRDRAAVARESHNLKVGSSILPPAT